MKTKLIVIFFLLVFGVGGVLRAEVDSTSSPQVAAKDAPQTLSQVQTYDQLVAAIRKTRAASQGRVEEAVRQEKVRECWETGKLIDEHVLQHKERADYADRTIVRLAGDLGTSETELRYMLQFARTYPIHRTSDELSWSHYESLLALNDDKEREEVGTLASREKWPVDRLREEVKKRKAAKNETPVPAPAEEKLTAKLGKPGTYKMVKMQEGEKNGATSQGPRATKDSATGQGPRATKDKGMGKAGNKGGPEAGELVIDLGFSNYYRTSRPLGFKEGAIIEALFAMPEGSSPSDKIRLSKRTADDLYTYRASIIAVLDGDTVNAVVDLGFGVRSVQTLRLRGIDAPELVSKEGKEAKAFLEQMINGTTSHEPRDTEKTGDTYHGPGDTKDSAMGQGPRDTKDGAMGEGQVRGAWVVERGTEVLIKTSKSDKYDRYLADVFVDKVYVNQALVQKGVAVRVRES